MIDGIDLRSAPFNLKASDIEWVDKTIGRMSTEAKVRQLFNEASHSDEPGHIDALAGARLGGITRFVRGDHRQSWAATRRLVEAAEIPLLISGDLEGGGIHVSMGTALPNQLGLAATGSPAITGEIIGVLAREAKALGFNWSFAPVVDINRSIRSAIVSTRSFGSNLDTILSHAQASVRAFQRQGIAATLKHWPGEGLDDRDQHLVTTINSMTMEQWHASFGMLYRTLIGEGVMSVMSGHIALPAWAHACGEHGHTAYMPASISALLNGRLLREELGFNGLIVSDATAMGGLTSWASRADIVPRVIESGCDMLLFPTPLEEDVEHMMAGLRSGALSERRLHEALARVLGMKAALGLHRKSIDELIPPVELWEATSRSDAHRRSADAAAGASITLVKDRDGILPLRPERYRRVVIAQDPERTGFPGATPLPLTIPAQLRARGFEVRDFDPACPPTSADTDLLIYLLAEESVLTKANIYLDWRSVHGNFQCAMRRFWHDMPTMLISLGHPYYLFDAPRMPCVINAYSCVEPVQQAVVRKLVGDEPFAGISPIDAFCGLPDAQF
jgi:beta-N-acetylhexosaminidase